MTTTQESAAENVAADGAARLAAQQVADLLMRVEQSADGRPFGNAETDGAAAMALASAATVVAEGPTRLIVTRAFLRVARAALAADPGGGAPPIAHAAVMARPTIGNDETVALVAQAREQSDPRHDVGLLGPARRALLLADAIALDPEAPAGDLDRLLRHLMSRCGPLAMKSGRRPVAELSQTARFVHVVSEIARARGDARLQRAAAAVFQPITGIVAASGAPATTDGAVPTAVLAQLILAASAVGSERTRDRMVHYIATARVDSRGAAKRVESNPWVPLALLAAGSRLDGLDEIVVPSVPDPPQAHLGAVRRHRDRIEFETSDGPVEVDGPLVGLLLDRALAALAGSPAAGVDPRVAAERVIALGELERSSGDLATRDFADRHIAGCLQHLIALQRRNGAFPRTSAQGAAPLATQDLALVGTALAIGLRRAGDPELRAALDRTRDHLVDVIGQVAYDGRQVWRSGPDDPVTARAGAPLERQAVVARFLSEAVRARPGPSALSQTLTSARQTISDVAETLGDERAVGLLPSEAALRVAIELTESAAALGDRRARRLARELVASVSRRMLESGAIPAIAGYVEELGDSQRFRPHREGIGPWPVRLSTQLLFVAAAAASGADRDATARALAFALLHLVDEPLGTMRVGYNRIGRLSAAQPAMPLDVAPVAILAAASVRRAVGMRVHLRRGTSRAAADRSVHFLRSLRGDGIGAGVPAEAQIALVEGDTALAVATRDEALLSVAERGLRAAALLVPARHAEKLVGDAVTPPDPVTARLALVSAQLARLGHGSGRDYIEIAKVALLACESFTQRGSRDIARGSRLDLRSTGGLRPWALAFGLTAATNRGEAARAAVWQTIRTVLAAQRQDGSWPALVAADEQFDVQLTVLEQLLAVERDVPSRGAIREALSLGAQSLESLSRETGLADRIRALAARLRIATHKDDIAQRDEIRSELVAAVSGHRTTFGGVSAGAPDERLRIYSSLAAVHATDRDWLR